MLEPVRSALQQQPRKALIVHQATARDFAEPAAFEKARKAATFVVALTALGLWLLKRGVGLRS